MEQQETNIPIPPARSGRKPKYDHSLLEALVVDGSVYLKGWTIKQADGVARRVNKRLGYQFTARTVEGGVRVWRTL